MKTKRQPHSHAQRDDRSDEVPEAIFILGGAVESCYAVHGFFSIPHLGGH